MYHLVHTPHPTCSKQTSRIFQHVPCGFTLLRFLQRAANGSYSPKMLTISTHTHTLLVDWCSVALLLVLGASLPKQGAQRHSQGVWRNHQGSRCHPPGSPVLRQATLCRAQARKRLRSGPFFSRLTNFCFGVVLPSALPQSSKLHHGVMLVAYNYQWGPNHYQAFKKPTRDTIGLSLLQASTAVPDAYQWC